MAKKFDYTLQIGADVDSFSDSLLEGIKIAQKEADKNKIVINITGDKEDLEKQLEQLNKNNYKVGASLELQIDKKDFEKEFTKLKKYSSQTGKKISESLRNEISNSFKSKGLSSFIKEYFNDDIQPTQKRIKEAIEGLYKDLHSYNLSEASGVDEIVSKIQQYEQLIRTFKDISESKTYSKADFGFTFDSKKVTKELDSFYRDAGLYIKQYSGQWAENIRIQYEDEMETLKDSISRLFAGLPDSNTEKIEEGFAAANKEITETENKVNSLKEELSNVNLKNIEKELLSLRTRINKIWDTGSDDKTLETKYVELLRSFKRYGGSITTQMKETYESIGDIRKIPALSSVKLLNQELNEAESALRKLKGSISDAPTSPQNAPTGVSSEEFEKQNNAYNELLSKHESLKTDLSEINSKYKEQLKTIEELQKKQKLLENVNDPKVLESSEYKKLITDLQSATSNASTTKEQLNNAEEQIERLYQRISEIQSGNVVDYTSYETANKVIDSLSAKIDEYKNKMQQLNTVLKQYEETNKGLSQTISNLENSLASQEEKLATNVAQIKELRAAYDELDKKQNRIMGSYDSLNAFNEAKEIVSYNEGKQKTPDGFIKFDYLEQIKKKMAEVGDEQNKLIKMAVYYNQYLQNGGTEKILGSDGKDISQTLIDTYQQLNVLADKNGFISEESINKAVRRNAKELSDLRIRREELEKENKVLREQIKLKEEAAAADKAMAKQTENKVETSEAKSNSSKGRKVTSADLLEAQRKREAASTKLQTETTASGELIQKVKLVPDTTTFKKDSENALSKINLNKDVKFTSDSSSIISGESNSFSQVTESVTKLQAAIESKTKAITQEKIAMDVAAQAEVKSVKDIINIIDELERKINTVADLIKTFPKFDKEIGILTGGSLKVDANFKKLIDQLKTFSDGQLSSNIATFSKALKELSEIKDLSHLNTADFDISKLIRATGKANQIIDLAESIALLCEYFREFNTVTFDGEILKNLTIKKSAITNTENLAYALDILKDALNSFDDNAKDALKSIKELTDQASALKDLNSILKSARKESIKEIVEQTTKTDEKPEIDAVAQAYDELTAKAKRYYDLLAKEQTAKGLGSDAEKLELANLKLQYEKAVRGVDEYAASTEKARAAQKRFNEEFEKTGETAKLNRKLVNESQRADFSKNITQYMQRNSAALKQYGDEIDRIISKLDNIKYQDELDSLKLSFSELQRKIISTGKTGISFVDKLKYKFKDLAAYLVSFVGFQDFIQIIQAAFTTIKELDDAYTEIRKVSDDPISTLKAYQKESFGIADAVGTTSKVLQNSTADWMRLGESLEDAKQSAQDAAILFNVSEYENIGDATESLVAMSQAYEEFEKIEIIDKLNNIGNNYSIATNDLASSLQRSAATLKIAGNTLDEAIALTTAGNSILQDPDSVGAGLKTISLRILGTEEAKEELEALGEDVDDFVVQTKSKLDEQVRSFTATAKRPEGISLLDDNGNYRSTYQILQDIADVYQEILETDKQFGTNRGQALVELLAGKNRANILSSILQAPDLLREVYESSMDSEGSAQKELENYMDSLSGRIEKLKNQLQELASVAFASDFFKVLIDGATGALSIVTDLIDAIGLIPTLLVGASMFGFGQFAKNFDQTQCELLKIA